MQFILASILICTELRLVLLFLEVLCLGESLLGVMLCGTLIVLVCLITVVCSKMVYLLLEK